MEHILYEKLRGTNRGMLALELAYAVKDRVEDQQVQSAAAALAYIMVQKRQGEQGEYGSCRAEIKKLLDKYSFLYSEELAAKFEKYTSDQLLSFILFDDLLDQIHVETCITPEGVCRLAAKILNIQEEDRVLELCSGAGGFLTAAAGEKETIAYKGIDLDYLANEIALLRSAVLGVDAEIELSDALEYREEQKADKIFANYPFGLRTPALKEQREQILQTLGIDKNAAKKVSSDWVFNTVIAEEMKESGRAVAIMTNGSTWNSFDQEVRRFFIEKGYIEAVISLPKKLFYHTSIPTTMVVFSRNNEKIRMIDASTICAGDRKNNTLTDAHIDSICSLLHKDSPLSAEKTIQEVAENDYVLNAVRYLERTPEMADGVEFGTVIKKIIRGSQLKAAELDELKSDKAAPNRLLMITNVQHGQICFEEDSQYLKPLPEKVEKYCVQDRAIVLSKIGVPAFKSAVAQVQAGEKLLANGNLFVIEVDEEKANPYYIQAFFASDAGAAFFRGIYSGTVIRSLSIDKLKKALIPLPPMEKQNHIAVLYRAALDEAAMLKRRLEKVSIRLSHIYDEEG